MTTNPLSPPPPRPAPVARPNSFGKAMLLAVMGVIVAFVIAFSSGKKPYDAGYLAGYLAAGPLLAGIAVGIWAKLNKRRWNWWAYFWRFAVVTVAILGLSAVGQLPKAMIADMTDLEKQHLVVSKTEARHTDFGFVVPLPTTGFQINEQLQEQANRSFTTRGLKGNYVWVLQDPEQAGVIMLIVSKGVGNNEQELRAFARGMQRGADKQGAQVLEDTLQWNDGAHEYRATTALPQGVYAKARCLSSAGKETTSFILCVQTVSADPNGLDAARAGVRLASWR